jgi:hypothetical protein
MAERTDITVDWRVSPRIITVASPSTEVTIQDLVDTLRGFEDDLVNMSYLQIISAAGKENLGGGVLVGITATLLDALLEFEARGGPTYTQCVVSGGNLVAVDSVGATQTTPISPTAFTQVVITASSSATTQNQSSLEYASFSEGVAIDVINGTAGTDFPQGTREYPVDNFADLHSISEARGLRKIFIMRDATLTGIDMSASSHQFIGDSPTYTLTVDPSADVTGSSMNLITVVGELDGLNVIRECLVGAITAVSGFIEKTAFQSTISTNGTTFIAECYSDIAGLGYPTITTGSNTLIVRDYHGSLGIAGMTGGTHTIEIYGGRLTVEASCSGGTIYARGSHSETINDLSGGAVTIVDQTHSLVTADAKRKASLAAVLSI